MANKEFYKLAYGYDIAFSDRDFQDEVITLLEIYKSHNAQGLVTPRVVIELGCGPANHLRPLAKIGVQCAGIDLSEDMIDYARNKDVAEDTDTITYSLQNMIDFHSDSMVDLVITPTESITHITNNTDMLTHLNSVAKSLNKGGVYIIESAHPRYFFPDDEDNIWEQELTGDRVRVQFGKVGDRYDSVAQVWDVTTSIELTDSAGNITKSESTSKHRWYLAQEFDLFGKLIPELELVAFYGSLSTPLVAMGSDSDEMIVVFVKK